MVRPAIRSPSLPAVYSGAQTAHFSFDLTLESFLEGHVRAFEFFGGVARECVYDNSRSAVARREREQVVYDQQYVDWRDGHCNARIHASGRFPVAERLAEERAALRPLPPARFDRSGHRSVRVPIDGYLKHSRCFYRAPERLLHERVELRFDRDEVWIVHRGVEVAHYQRSYEQGIWLPPPIMRPEPPAPPP